MSAPDRRADASDGTGLKISAAFATTLETPEHVQIAERVGYCRGWLYDTPQLSLDVWMVLALAAARTHSIWLGPGVLVPTLRHPMVNAARRRRFTALPRDAWRWASALATPDGSPWGSGRSPGTT